ncbi:MAG: UDP-N-acetylmuramoyl-L-alanine--D-glutamate ligase [Actinomycetota bacterium]|nr:UDP-N-acetylmuramoyl-L-alanine--D-glutamate ligase [Actinomycetota bacterium]
MKTLVYGLGESGIAATRALLARGADVLAADANDGDSLRAKLSELGVEGRLGAGPEVLENVDRVVVSPGVRPSDPVLRAAERRRIPVVSEVALGLKLLGPGVRVAAVTGTNGKTTVVDMLHRVLDAAGVPHTVAGNSWRAPTGCLDEILDTGLLVLEVSSFQLHYMTEPGFQVAALLNARPDHLDWHSSFEEYRRDKLRIFEGQGPEDLALVGAGDPVGHEAVPGLTGKPLLIGEGDTAVRNGRLFLRGRPILRTEEFSFAGTHNFENALFAAAAAEALGVERAAIRDGLLGYRLKPHRLEVIAEYDGVAYVDDSKATNPAAVAAALGGLDRTVVLILGGSEKHTDFSEILTHLGGCRAVLCQGEAGPRIAGFIEDEGYGGGVERLRDLGPAVSRAAEVARPGDVVLLSPGCASFDQFAGYAERGEAFARLARGLAGRHGVVGR